MNLLVGIITTVFLWSIFSSFNQLKIAGDSKGCCTDGTCGKGYVDNFLFYTNLVLAIILTLGVLFKVFEDFVVSPGSSLPGGIPIPQILDNI